MSGWCALRAAAAEPAARLTQALEEPAASQEALLKNILHRNAGTEFGRRHGFDRIDGVAQFRDCVPVGCYADIAGQIDAIAECRGNSLTADPVIAFERTGGTASGGKLIPYTADALASFRAAILPWLLDLAAKHPAVTKGPAYVAISPATRALETTLSGIPVGLASDAAYLGHDLAPSFASLLAVPPQLGAITDVAEWRLATLAGLIARPDLAFVSVWSPTFLLALLDAIVPNADAIAARLEPHHRQRLAQALASGSLEAERLWPRLALVSCWADAGSSAFAARLARLLPQALLQPKGLLATESAMTIPLGRDPGAVPALTSAVIEFRDEAGDCHLADTVEPGRTYDLILTTWGGLYRYAIGDRVRCIGRHGKSPRLVFEGRSGIVSDMVGEKLDEAFVASLLARLPLPARLVAHERPVPHYELQVDGEASPALQATVEAGLAANPQYAYARRIGQLGTLQAASAPGFATRDAEAKATTGRRLGDIKPALLLPAGTGVS